MNHYENKEAKKYLAAAVIVAVFAAAVVGMVMFAQGERQRKLENVAFYALLEEVQKTSPQTDGKRLMHILNHAENYRETDFVLLRQQYGLTGREPVLLASERLRTEAMFSAILILIAAEGLLIGIFSFYLMKRRKKIEVLSDYMERISMGHYDLDLSDNSEDELSNLKNQLYKLTVMLREQAETAVTQKKALAESVSDISHQLKTPLTSAMILLGNLTDRPDMEASMRKKFLAEASRQVDSMKWLIVSMLKLSRLDAGMVKMERKKFSVVDMVRSGVDYLGVLTDLAGVSVEEEGDWEIQAGGEGVDADAAEEKASSKQAAFQDQYSLYGDRHWNQEAFINLLKNAVEHSKAGETIRVKIEANDVYLAVSVSNRGEPFTRMQEKEMFRRYYSAANRPGDENAGIGLPMAKAILERQNGYLTVKSEEGWNTFTMKYLKAHR